MAIKDEKERTDFEDLHRLIAKFIQSKDDYMALAFSGSKLLKCKIEKKAYETEEQIYSEAVTVIEAMQEIQTYKSTSYESIIIAEEAIYIVNISMQYIHTLRRENQAYVTRMRALRGS